MSALLDNGNYDSDEAENDGGRNRSRKPQELINCVQQYVFPIKTWEIMIERNYIPEFVQGKRVVYELDSNYLLVKLIASPAHDAAANALNDTFTLWSRNGGVGPKTLKHLGQRRMVPV